MKPFAWNPEKNVQLIKERGVSFERIISRIENGGLVCVFNHHNPEQYPNQRIMVVDIEGYAYLVPFVYNDQRYYFLKTIIPSRKATSKNLEIHHEPT